MDGERRDGCIDVSVLTQHARRASANKPTAKTYAVAKAMDLNPIGVMMASGNPAISEAAGSVGRLHEVFVCCYLLQFEDLLVAGT